jgi:hypothetical protein
LRMVRTKARDSYSAKLCPMMKFRSCSMGFRRQNSLRLHYGKSVKGQTEKSHCIRSGSAHPLNNGLWAMPSAPVRARAILLLTNFAALL